MKRIFAVILLVFMISGMLASCTSVQDDKNTSLSDNENTEKEDINAPEEAPDDGDTKENQEENQPEQKPDDPTVDPDEPTVDPDEPTVDPDEPTVDPDEPTVDPDEPTVDPDEPTVDPDDPAVDPDEPTVDPDEPTEPALPEYGTGVGYRFKDMSLVDVNGNTVNTEDLRGKVIVFNVWATWCPPCVSELPEFNEVAAEYKDNVVIIAVHCYDSYMYDMPSYVESNFPDTNIIFAYDNAYSEAYYAAGGIGYVPQTAIIDKDGIIRYSDSGSMNYDALTSLIKDCLYN